MLKVIIPIVIALAIIVGCVIYLQSDLGINSGEEDVLHNEIVYERIELPNCNLEFSEKNTKYIGDFMETYQYGQQLPWEVYSLNAEEKVLASAHAVWIKPGYVLPKEYGEAFASAEYVVSEGIDFFMMDDTYSETATLLSAFSESVKLEDIIEAEASQVAEYTEHGTIRLKYKNHKDMFLLYTLCSHEDAYYLNVLQGTEGTDALFAIKPEYVELLTSALVKAE